MSSACAPPAHPGTQGPMEEEEPQGMPGLGPACDFAAHLLGKLSPSPSLCLLLRSVGSQDRGSSMPGAQQAVTGEKFIHRVVLSALEHRMGKAQAGKQRGSRLGVLLLGWKHSSPAQVRSHPLARCSRPTPGLCRLHSERDGGGVLGHLVTGAHPAPRPPGWRGTAHRWVRKGF